MRARSRAEDDEGRESDQARECPGNDRNAHCSRGDYAQGSVKFVFVDGHGWHSKTAILLPSISITKNLISARKIEAKN
jgi:hypothetical protein